MIANYHTHTFRCHHAGDFSDEEYVLSALDAGLKILGFSDHAPWPYKSDYVGRTRMLPEGLEEYIQSINLLKEKYRDRIQIFLGMECEYYPDYLPWLEKLHDSMDYLIFGCHWGPSDEHGELYFRNVTETADLQNYFTYVFMGMESGLFSYLAHPDLAFSNYREFDNVCIDSSYALCRKARSLDLPLEYNISGFRQKERGKLKGLGYPCNPFWEIAKETGCRAIIGVDAHGPDDIRNSEAICFAESYLEKLGIEVLETLPSLGV